MIRYLNVCFDKSGKIKCGNEYDDWCKTCPNFANKKVLEVEVND